MHADLPTLNRRFAIEDVLRFSAGEGGLWRASITTDKCTAEFYRHGAHLTRWRPKGFDDVLWVSSKAKYEYGSAIRGGVPICFPWFAGNKPAYEFDGPSHGYARIQTWRFTDVTHDDAGLTITMAHDIDPFGLVYAVTFSDTLTMKLTVTNNAVSMKTFEAALHTYFSISQIKQVTVHGLEHADYLDTVGGGATPKTQDGQPITFDQETDRTYTSTANTRIHDPGMGRSITIDKTGSDSTIVWNPWIGKAKTMWDFGNDEWPGMLCVETANTEPNHVTLDPGASHTMSATVRVEHI